MKVRVSIAVIAMALLLSIASVSWARNYLLWVGQAQNTSLPDQLRATGLFQSGDNFVLKTFDQDVGQLADYDAVLVEHSTAFNPTESSGGVPSSTVVGNKLADYVDAGGGVVMIGRCFLGPGGACPSSSPTQYCMYGRIMDQNYTPIDTGIWEYRDYLATGHMIPGYDASSPLMAGVSSVTGQYAVVGSANNKNEAGVDGGCPAHVVAQFARQDTGGVVSPFVAWKQLSSTKGKVVGISLGTGANPALGGWTGDLLRLLANSIQFVQMEIPPVVHRNINCLLWMGQCQVANLPDLLQATGQFLPGDTFSYKTFDQDVGPLTNYDVVVVEHSTSFFPTTGIGDIPSSTEVGNRLADYVDSGGGVIMMGRCFLGPGGACPSSSTTQYCMYGRIMDQNYTPINTGIWEYRDYLSTGCMIPGYNSSSPLMAGVSSVTGQYAIVDSANNKNESGVDGGCPAHVVAQFARQDTGGVVSPFVAWKQLSSTKGKVVGISLGTGANPALGGWTGDLWRLLANSIQFAKPEQPMGIDHNINYSDDVTVDGNLADWANATWIDETYPYYPSDGLVNSDMTTPQVAFKWGAGGTKVYVAARVHDSQRVFLDEYTSWDASDRLEAQIWASSRYGLIDLDTEDISQQYAWGLKTGATTWWSVVGSNDSVPTCANFSCAAKLVGDMICYEGAMTPFELFNDETCAATPTYLTENQVIRADACIASKNSSGNYNQVAFNSFTDKYYDTANIERQNLTRHGVKGTITLQGHSGSLRGIAGTATVKDGLGNVVETHKIVLDGDGVYSFETALSGDYTVVIALPGYVTGSQSVTINAEHNGTANYTLVQVGSLPKVGANNKAVLDHIMNSAAGKYTWVLWGKVSERSADGFKIDDGSGVVITVDAPGNTVANDNYVSVIGSLDAAAKKITAEHVDLQHN